MSKQTLNLINLCYKWEKVPANFTMDLIRMIYKKAHKADARHYRPISLIIILAKIIQSMTYARIMDWLEKQRKEGKQNISDMQFGGRKGRDRWMMLMLLTM
jgi:hypothetical protein